MYVINCSKGTITPSCAVFVRAHVRLCVHTSRWKKLFTPFLVVELSPRAESWYMYVTSISDGSQILIFPGINNNHDLQNFDCFHGFEMF